MINPIRFLALLARYGAYPRFCERLRRIVTVEWLWPYVREAGRILEIGAGDGQTVCFLARRFPEKEFVAGEPDDKQLQQLTGRVQSAGLRNVAIRRSVFNADSPHVSYDLIYAVDVLEHIPDDVGFLVNARRLLHPDGRLFLHVPVPGIQPFEDPGHVRAGYEMNDLRERLTKTSYSIERMEYTFGRRGLRYHHGQVTLSQWKRMLIHLLDVADNHKVRSEIGVMAKYQGG